MNTSKYLLETELKVLPVVMAMLALAGCAGTHVSDDWQCPLAQGEVCASVSAADPAVQAGVERVDSPLPAGEIPLYRPSERDGPPPAREVEKASTEAEKECGRGFGLLLPFAWLGKLFGVNDAAADDIVGSTPHPDDGPAGVTGPHRDADAAETTLSIPNTKLSDDAGKNMGTRVPTGPAHDDAREPERIGRVWIGPFVDTDGVYREASWVRIVIAPAEWRIP